MLKDDALVQLARAGNVAAFISFGPDPSRGPRHVVLPADDHDDTVEAQLARLIGLGEGKVNVRSFQPESPKSREFVMGLETVDDVLATVERLAAEGLHTIVNESIDVADGGVSGVVLGDVIEFTPDDTPRGVERAGTTRLPRGLGLQVLTTVYGFRPSLDYDHAQRVEFSIHPRRRGVRQGHTIVWEIEKVGASTIGTVGAWPNNFSRLLGDKCYGLLLADTLELPVPAATVVSRRVAPFTFGRATGLKEVWFRTCPTEQQPGQYSTTKGWTDPFALMAAEDSHGTAIASVLAQQAVDARFSGAAVPQADGVTIEGVTGEGEAFMQGGAEPESLPKSVRGDVARAAAVAAERIGAPVRIEWVHDGEQVWIVQLHHAGRHTATELVSGDVATWRDYDPGDGLDVLRALIADVSDRADVGIRVTRPVGVTSHVGDLLRKAQVPSRIATTEQPS